MRVFDLALKDLKQVTRDWRSALFLLIMPLAFTVMFGFAFGGFGGNEENDPRLPVGFQNQYNGVLSGHLVDL